MLRQSLGVLQAINIVSAVKWEGPKSTAGGSTATLSANYEPTAVAEVMKRDSWPPSYCGFIGGTSCRFLLPPDSVRITVGQGSNDT
jgi:hypothetical protein